MKSFVVILILAIAAVGQSSSTSSGAAPGSATPAQTSVQEENVRKAKTLLEQMIQALGGPAYLNIQDMRQEGRTYGFYHGQSSGAGALYWRFWKWPDKDRIELTKKRDWVIIHNGDNGYEVTFHGTAPEEHKALDDFIRRRQFSLEWVLRRWLTEPGIALFYEGRAVAAQKQTEQVSILNAKNESVTLYIDTNTHLPVKKSFSWRDPTDRERNQEDEIYDNYKTVQGVATPLSVTRFYNGDMIAQRFISSVAYNQGVPDSMFQTAVDWDPSKPVEKKK